MAKSPHSTLVVVLFFLSGISNLVYEIVWARMFNLVLGVSVFAVSAVLASFMLGLATGGILFGRLADRWQRPMVVFALLHAGIFASAIGIVLVQPAFRGLYVPLAKLVGESPFLWRSVVLLLSLLLLAVPTTLMGATFPVASKIVLTGSKSIGRDVGTLYSLHTVGSVMGCVVTVFFLLEYAGMKGAAFSAGALDLAIALAAFGIDKLPIRGSSAS